MKNRLQFIEIATLIYFFIRATYIGIGINSYLYYAKVDSYLSILIGSIIGILPLLIIIKIMNIRKDKNIHQMIEELLGKKLGKVISFLLLGFTFFFATVAFYDLINFIASEYLYKTPPILIGIMIIIPIIYILSKGLKTICRTSIILFMLSMILYSFSMIGLIPNFSINKMFPFLENGIKGPLIGSIHHIAYAVLPLFTLTIIPKQDYEKGKKVDKKIMIVQLMVTLLIFISLCNVIGVLGINLAILYQYPDYHMLRRIQVGGFIQRTESILAIQWLICLFMMIVFCMYYCIKTISILTPKWKIKYDRLFQILFPTGMLILSRNIWRNNTSFVYFTTHSFPIYIYIFFLGIPVFLLMIYYIKKMQKKM